MDTPNGEHTLTFINQPTPGAQLTIRKTDPEGKPLAGVTMKVTDGSGAPIGSDNGIYVTGENGEIVLISPSVQPGMIIKAWETATIPGYELDTTPQTIIIKENGKHTLTFINKPTPSAQLTIRKTDPDGKPLAGVTMKVTDGSGAPIGPNNGKYVTGKDGQITISAPDIKPGMTVKVYELETIPGYELDSKPQTIVIAENGKHELTFINKPTPGAQLTIRKTDPDGKPLGGVTMKVMDSKGTVIGTSDGKYVTSENGEIVIASPDITPGMTIKVWEIKTIEGYELDTTPKTIVIQANKSHTLTFINQPIPAAQLTILKTDPNGKPLAGVTMKVTDGGETPIGPNNGLYVTQDNGEIVISTSDIRPGMTVKVWETKTIPGYELDTRPQTIIITEESRHKLTFVNQPTETATLIIRKISTDKEKTPLSDVDFKITQIDGTVIGPNNGEYTTNSAGEIVITSPDIQPEMTIKVWETRTIDGYKLDTTPQTIKIEGNKTHTLVFRNEPIVPSGLVILKRDKSDGTAIKGITFEISKMNGEHAGTYRTDSRGMISLPDLAPGWYLVTEAEAKGYILDPEPHRVEIKEGQTTTLELFNKKASSILLRKVDEVSGDGIYGVTFLLYDSGKNPIGQYTSAQDGYVYLHEELTDGKYFIRELESVLKLNAIHQSANMLY